MLFYVSKVHVWTILYVHLVCITLSPAQVVPYMICGICVFNSAPCSNSNKYAGLVNIINLGVVFLSERTYIAFRTVFVTRTNKKQYQKTSLYHLRTDTMWLG